MQSQMLDDLVIEAQNGSTKALDELVRQLKGPLFTLALRMLYHPQDAEDALQEILIKIVTHIGNYKGRSSFRTYAFRIAVNHLLTKRTRRDEHPHVSFDELAERIVPRTNGVWPEEISDVHQQLLVRELRLHCLQALLLVLSREHRLAYILGEIFDLSARQAAAVLEISSVAFRKRLSRSRQALRNFMQSHCSLIRPANVCDCHQQTAHFVRCGALSPRRAIFAGRSHTIKDDRVFLKRLRELDDLQRIRNLFKNYPDLTVPETVVSRIRALMTSQTYDVLRSG
jgi:RNA polymerase sigma factor (sigma-70 family)